MWPTRKEAVKAALQSFDRAGLVGLIQDLYAVDKNNEAFLHARLGPWFRSACSLQGGYFAELWPKVVRRLTAPEDLEEILLIMLEPVQ